MPSPRTSLITALTYAWCRCCSATPTSPPPTSTRTWRAACADAETNERLLLRERAPEEGAGASSRFPAGLFRVAYDGVGDLKKVMPDLSAEEIARTDFGAYTADQFLDDMARVTEFRCDPDLTEILVTKSLPAVEWVHREGVGLNAACARQAFTAARTL